MGYHWRHAFWYPPRVKRVPAILCLYISVGFASAANPGNDQHFEQVSAWEEVSIRAYRELFMPGDRVDVYVGKKVGVNGMSGNRLLTNVKVTAFDESSQIVKIRVTRKEAQIIRFEISNRQLVFLNTP